MQDDEIITTKNCIFAACYRKPENTLFMGKKSGKKITIVNTFGNDVDYFLFSTRTKVSIFTLAEQLADHCGCHFNLMPVLRIPDSDVCHMLPEFRMMYAQYKTPMADGTFAQDPVDHINFIIFQNQAIYFDKSKSGLAREDYNGAFPFIDDDCFCHAFSSEGVKIHKCASADFADYYLMIFAKKNKDADKLAAHLTKIKDIAVRDLTNELYTKTPQNEDLPKFFRAIFANAENQIRQLMRCWERNHVGKIPQSMAPVDIREILRKLSLSNSEVSINNL